VRVPLVLSLAAAAALGVAAPVGADPPPAQACPAVTVGDQSITVSAAVDVAGPLPAGGALVTVRNVGCSEAYDAVRLALTVAGDEVDELAQRRLRVRSVRSSTRAGQRVRTVVAAGPPDRLLVYTTPGPLRVDRSILRAGQHVNFYRGRGASACTAAWIVRRGGRLFGLTAGHCARRSEIAVRVRGLDAPPRRPLGPVVWNGDARGGPDALAFAVGSATVNQAVERGTKLPWTVTGWRPTAAQRSGLRVCFSGRTTGRERCGTVVQPRFRRGRRRLVCTDLRLRDGDSGGPVYTAPADGAVEALGIVTGSRTNIPPFTHGEGCYTPIQGILSAFGATLPAGPRPSG
jgi:hypothetical protein